MSFSNSSSSSSSSVNSSFFLSLSSIISEKSLLFYEFILTTYIWTNFSQILSFLTVGERFCSVLVPFIAVIETLVFAVAHCFELDPQNKKKKKSQFSYDDFARFADESPPCKRNDNFFNFEYLGFLFWIFLNFFWCFCLIYLQLQLMKWRHCMNCSKNWVALLLMMA